MTAQSTASLPILATARPGNWPARRRAMFILSAAFFLTMATFSYLAPCGSWRCRVFRATMAYSSDPAGPYVISSLYMFGAERFPPAALHPGLTLQALIAALAHAGHGISLLLGGSESFIAFWARNMRWLFIMAGLLNAAMHVLSFYALFAFAKRLLDDERAAFIGVLFFATLFPTLYFGPRIAVEPILVLTILLTMLWLWDSADAWSAGRRGRAILMALLASFAAVAALHTKIHTAFPLIPLGILQLLLQSSGDGSGWVRRVRSRWTLAACFILFSAVFMLAWSWKMDWGGFFAWWAHLAPGSSASDDDGTIAGPGAILQGAWSSFCKNLRMYRRFSRQGIFLMTEWGLILLAPIAFISFWRSRPEKRRLVAWLLLYGLVILPIACFRGMWHYFFFYMACGSVFIGFLIQQCLQRLLPSARVQARMTWAIVIVLLLHGVSILFFLAAKTHDAKAYARTFAPWQQALGRLEPGGRIAVLSPAPPALYELYVFSDTWLDMPVDFHDVFSRQFAYVGDEQSLTRTWAGRNSIQVVLDLRGKPKVVPVGQWRFAGKPPSPSP